ncbi:MAG: ABC transporter permease [Caldiserica bacterium]|nr:ABC transporter permease [Caldisericota bacterium]
MKRLLGVLHELTRFKAALVGLVILSFIVGLAIYTVIAIPYGEAVRLWRGGEEMWRYNPVNAEPAWVNYFTPKRLPVTRILSSAGDAEVREEPLGKTSRKVYITYTFDYRADVAPSELALVYKPVFEKKGPLVSVTWVTPDGREIKFGRMSIKSVSASGAFWYPISLDKQLIRRFGDQRVEEGFFNDPNDPTRVLKGTHKVTITAFLFEPEAKIETELVLYGTVHGLAGTDHRRRDITIALMWGTPVALSFGLAAALGTMITSIIIAALGAWFGGWADSLVQRLTEIRMIIPTLPILIMVGMFFSKSIWAILATLLILNIIESSIKNYRAIFLQEKHAPYIEAARGYGAGHLRIVFRYLIPKIVPMLVPSFVLAVPGYVFLEAALAVLGLGDPVLPTWGKVLSDAYGKGALFQGHYYWVLEPAFMLMITGFGFTMIGYALDRIFNPRLREI